MSTVVESLDPVSSDRVQISYNLSSIFKELLPSRLFSGSKRFAFELNVEPNEVAARSFPGPLSFFTSGYMLGLVVMAIVLHRIQHTVVARSPIRIPHARPRSSYGRTLFLRRLLPLDLGHTPTRLALHLPTLYLLAKMLLLWSLLIIQTSEFTIWNVPMIQWAVEKEMSYICWSTFCAICAAFCVEAFVRALDGHTTPGAAFGLGAGDNPNTSPFNLVGYAFLLHIYSSPASHTYRPESGPTRPDKHVVITVAIPLLQLTLLHIFSTSKRLSTHRLLPTAISSILSLSHFHLTLLAHFVCPDLCSRIGSLFGSRPTPPPLAPSPASPTLDADSLAFIPPTPLPLPFPIPMTSTPSFKPPFAPLDQNNPKPIPSPNPGVKNAYPLLNYVPNTFESLLLLSVVLSCTIRLIARVLGSGSLSSAPSGSVRARRRRRGRRGEDVSENPENGNQGGSVRAWLAGLPWEEDFGVLLLRAGIRSLEGGGALGGGGGGNEVAGVNVTIREGQERSKMHEEREYGRMRIGRGNVDVTGMVHASVTSTKRVRSEAEQNRRGIGRDDVGMSIRKGSSIRTKTRTLHGLHNEIRTVTPFSLSHSPRDGDVNGGGSRGGMYMRSLLNTVGRPRLWEMWHFARGLVRCFWNLATYAFKRLWRRGVKSEENDLHGDMDRDLDQGREEGEDDVYSRFLRGDMFDSEGDSDSDGDFDVATDEDGFGDDEDDLGVSGDEEESVSEDLREGSESGKREAVELLYDLIFGRRSREEEVGGGSGGGNRGEESSSALSRLVLSQQGGEGGMMTRRRLGRLIQQEAGELGAGHGYEDEDAWIERQRQHGAHVREREREEQEEEERDWCVVCMTEGREVICWPCRCLAMCDGCREALATRSSPGKHRCPCCRRSVEGFSKIYVP